MVISERQMGHPRACCSNWATHRIADARTAQTEVVRHVAQSDKLGTYPGTEVN